MNKLETPLLNNLPDVERNNFKCYFDLALVNKISWEVVTSFIEPCTPTLEKSREIIRLLLTEIQILQTKLQQKNTNFELQDESPEYVLVDLMAPPEKELENGEKNKEVKYQISKIKKELPERKNENKIKVKQELPVENTPILKDMTNLQSFDSKATIKLENQDVSQKVVLQETKHIYLPEFDTLPKGASFECMTCLEKFPSFTMLQNHLKMHAQERPFVCRFCQKRFKHSTHLKEHEFIHSGKTPYRCTTCGKCFAKSSDLKKHENIILKKNHFSVKNAPKGSL